MWVQNWDKLNKLVQDISCLKYIIKTNYTCLRLTKLYNILLLYYYWPLGSASMDHQANIYKKKLKNAGVFFVNIGLMMCHWGFN